MSDYTPKNEDAPKTGANSDARTDAQSNPETQEARANLREAGDAILAAGSAIGAALGKFAEGLPDRFKNASDSARETLNAATTEGEVRSVAANFTNEAEKVFNSLRERDLKFTEDAKAKLSSTITDIRSSFNDRMDKADTSGADSTISELRSRFDDLVDRVQKQFTGDDNAGHNTKHGDVIDGEVVETDSTEKP